MRLLKFGGCASYTQTAMQRSIPTAQEANTIKTFAEFVATRTHHADIAAAYGDHWESMMLPTPIHPGWLYEGDDGDTYFMFSEPGKNRRGEEVTTYGCLFENNEVYSYALESAEAQLFVRVYHDSPEAEQFHAMAHAFPDYDDVLPVFKGMTESSWKNDTSPKLTLDFKGYEAVLWCDYRTQELREYNEEASPQFCLTIGSEDGDYESVQESTMLDAIPTDIAQQILSKMFQHWTQAQGLPAVCAEELIHGELSAEQRRWVSEFITAWDNANV